MRVLHDDQVEAWRHVAKKLGIAVVSPCDIALSNGQTVRVTALVEQFGCPKGIVADPEYGLIEHNEAFSADGYGISIVSIPTVDELGPDSLHTMLMDWGWNDAAGPRPGWLVQAFGDQSRKWRELGAELGFTVVAPWRLNIDGAEAVAIALIKNFGSEKGTLVITDRNISEAQAERLAGEGYVFSDTTLDLSETGHDSAVYILSERGWAGAAEKKPKWIMDN